MRPTCFLALAMAAFLAGCTQTPLSPSAVSSFTSTVGSLNAAADVDHTELKVPVPVFTALIPCVPEVARVTDAELHVVMHRTLTASGHLHVSGHFQPIGNWDGIGQVTGDVYQAVGVTRQNFNVDNSDGAPFEQTFVNNFRWIGRGPGNNLQVHTNMHITINANGDLTVNHVNASVTCR